MTEIANKFYTDNFRPIWRGPLKRDLCGVPRPAVEAFIRCELGEKAWPLVFVGETGTGKTCAAYAIMDRVAYYRWHMSYSDAASQLGTLRGGRESADYRSEEGFWADVRNAAIALMDDLGTREHVTPTAYDAIKTFLDIREHRPAIVTTNLTVANIGKVFDQRVSDRIAGGTLVKFVGTSRRRNEWQPDYEADKDPLARLVELQSRNFQERIEQERAARESWPERSPE